MDNAFKEYVGKARVLGIDYGDKRIGVALSDIGWMIASPLLVLDNHGAIKRLCSIILENLVMVVVIGLPIGLDGHSAGPQIDKVKKFAEKLEESASLDIPYIKFLFQDERLSSVAANRLLSEAGINLSMRQKNVDKIAASFILQGFLDSNR
jgi:putative Holliday junction resolvase